MTNQTGKTVSLIFTRVVDLPQPYHSYIHVLRCKMCDFMTLNHTLLKDHLRTEHPDCNGFLTYSCCHCSSMSTEKRLMEEHLELYHQSVDNLNGKLIERYNRQSSYELSNNISNTPTKSMTFSSASAVNNAAVVPLTLNNSGQTHHSGLPINLLNAFNILQQGNNPRLQSNLSAMNFNHSSSTSSAPVGIQYLLSPTSLSNAMQNATTTTVSNMENTTTSVNHSTSTVTASFLSGSGSGLTHSVKLCSPKIRSHEGSNSPDEVPGEESAEGTTELHSVAATTTTIGNMNNTLGGSIGGVSGSRRRKATIPGRICLEASSIVQTTNTTATATAAIDGVDSEEDHDEKFQFDGSLEAAVAATATDPMDINKEKENRDKSDDHSPSPKRPCLVMLGGGAGSPMPGSSPGFTAPASPSFVTSSSVPVVMPLPTGVSTVTPGQPVYSLFSGGGTGDQPAVNPTWLLTGQPTATPVQKMTYTPPHQHTLPVVCASPTEPGSHPGTATATVNLGGGNVIRLSEILELIKQMVVANNNNNNSNSNGLSSSCSPLTSASPVQLTSNATPPPQMTTTPSALSVMSTTNSHQQQHQLYAVSNTASADATNTFRLVDIHPNRSSSSTPTATGGVGGGGGGLLLVQTSNNSVTNPSGTNCVFSTGGSSLNSTSLASLVASLTGGSSGTAWLNSVPVSLQPGPQATTPTISTTALASSLSSDPTASACAQLQLPTAVVTLSSSEAASRLALPTATTTTAGLVGGALLTNATTTTNSGYLNTPAGGSMTLQLAGRQVVANGGGGGGGGVDDQALDMSVRSQMASILNESLKTSVEAMEEQVPTGELKYTNRDVENDPGGGTTRHNNNNNNNALITTTIGGSSAPSDGADGKLVENHLCKPIAGVGETAAQPTGNTIGNSTGNYTIVIDLVNAALKSGGISIRQRLASSTPAVLAGSDHQQQQTNGAETTRPTLDEVQEAGGQPTKCFASSSETSAAPEGDAAAATTLPGPSTPVSSTSQSQLLILGQLHAIISALANNAGAVSFAGPCSLSSTLTTSTATATSSAATGLYGSPYATVPASSSLTGQLAASTISSAGQQQPSTIASALSSVGLQLRPPTPGQHQLQHHFQQQQQQQQRQQHLLVNLATSNVGSPITSTTPTSLGTNGTIMAPLPIPDAVASLLWPTISSLTGITASTASSTLPATAAVATPSNAAAAVAAVAAAAQSMMAIPGHFANPSGATVSGHQGLKNAALLTGNPTLLNSIPGSFDEGAQGAVNALNSLVSVSGNLTTSQAATLFTGGNQAAIINFITNSSNNRNSAAAGQHQSSFTTALNASETSRLLSNWTQQLAGSNSGARATPPPHVTTLPPPITSSNSLVDFPQLPLGVTVNNNNNNNSCLTPGAAGILTTSVTSAGTLNLFNPTHAALLAAAAASGVNGTATGPLNQISLSALRNAGNNSSSTGSLSSASMMTTGRLPLTAHHLVGGSGGGAAAGVAGCPVISLIDTSGLPPGSSAGGIHLRLATAGDSAAQAEEAHQSGYHTSQSSLLAPPGIDLTASVKQSLASGHHQLDCSQDLSSTFLFGRPLDGHQLSVVSDCQHLPDLPSLSESTPTAGVGGSVSSGRRRRRPTQLRKPGDLTKPVSPYTSSTWDSAVLEESYPSGATAAAAAAAALICGAEPSGHDLFASSHDGDESTFIGGLLVKSDPLDSSAASRGDGSSTGNGQQQSRPHRQNFTPTQNRILTDWYDFHQSKPYPSTDDTRELANKSGLTYSQVKKWFANKRARSTSNGLPRPTPPLAPDSSADPTAVEAVVANALAKANRSLIDPPANTGSSSSGSSSSSSSRSGGGGGGLAKQESRTASDSATAPVKQESCGLLSPLSGGGGGEAIDGGLSCRSSLLTATAVSPTSAASSVHQPEVMDTAVAYPGIDNDDAAVSDTDDNTVALDCTGSSEAPAPADQTEDDYRDQPDTEEELVSSDGDQLVIHLPPPETPVGAGHSPTASSPPTLEVHLNPRLTVSTPEPVVYLNGVDEEEEEEEPVSSPLAAPAAAAAKGDADSTDDLVQTSGSDDHRHHHHHQYPMVDEAGEDEDELQKQRPIRHRSINLRTG